MPDDRTLRIVTKQSRSVPETDQGRGGTIQEGVRTGGEWRGTQPVERNTMMIIKTCLLFPLFFHDLEYRIVFKFLRFDCPAQWPELVPTLLEKMKSSVRLEQHRALLIFHDIVKTLAAKRLAVDKRMFQVIV